MIFEFIKVHKCEEGMMLVTTKSHKYVCNDNLKVSKRKFNRLKRSDNIASPFFLQICTKGLENVKFFVRKKWQKCHHSVFFLAVFKATWQANFALFLLGQKLMSLQKILERFPNFSFCFVGFKMQGFSDFAQETVNFPLILSFKI